MLTNIKTLLLEDDPILSREVQYFLQSKQIECDVVFDGEAFFKQYKNNPYDVYLLDINVPKLNGIEVCKRIRENDTSTPVLMLTAYGDIQDKVDAYKMGADDYLVKPFHFEELYMRITSLIRRSAAPQKVDTLIVIGDLAINETTMVVKRGNEVLDLTPKEYQLLVLLAKANGRVLSKQTIAEQVWDIHFETSLNTIEVYINFLRKKVDKNYEHKLIQTRPGFGYFIKTGNTL